jgi:hypothetical protein
MKPLTSFPEARGARQAAGEEFVGLLLGAGFTLALFVGLAHFENFGTAAPVVEIEDLRMTAMPLEPPPPPPQLEESAPVPPEVLPLSGLEVGAADSLVSVAVVPPDLESLIPATASPPTVRIQFAELHSEFKPKVSIETDLRHVYQDSEVDQRPHELVRTVPLITADVRGDAPTLRVGLLLLIGLDGKPESARVVQSSGNPRFDAIVATTVRDEWLFSPALRRGKKVRVLAQQAFRINFTSGGSPLALP